jgi:hypothetical protein
MFPDLYSASHELAATLIVTSDETTGVLSHDLALSIASFTGVH